MISFNSPNISQQSNISIFINQHITVRAAVEVSKKWFRLRDTYGVEIEPSQDDIVILAVTVCIDQMANQFAHPSWFRGIKATHQEDLSSRSAIQSN